jgi:hypothetical protein
MKLKVKFVNIVNEMAWDDDKSLEWTELEHNY